MQPGVSRRTCDYSDYFPWYLLAYAEQLAFLRK